ncbi:hypothetical protein KP509_37G019800 [Ceratopteris richardii]|uniref:Uncharacterized protein n=1 Tax=Ceratopteris richardii TaxID=49495 RepID=A0A8T2Q703_CERRI|nr:hypothetical protein KP509_37G019800 [Ceratopteris richardii]
MSNSKMASEGTTAKVAERLSQTVLSVYTLTDLIRSVSPIEVDSNLSKELLAKASNIKNTGILLRQMPSVIAALDAHSDKSIRRYHFCSHFIT